MAKDAKLLAAVRNNPRDVRFRDLLRLLASVGFAVERISGSHHILRHGEHRALQLTLQPRGDRAVEYQVREALRLIDAHSLALEVE